MDIQGVQNSVMSAGRLEARNAADPAKAEELQKQLAAVETELRQKDNDAYRRQHASVT